MAKLIKSRGKGPALVVELTDGLTIGRDEGVGLTLDDTKASRHHAKVVAIDGGFAIKDLDSTNGTLVNGDAVKQVMLRHGDKVRIGTTTLVYDNPEAPAPRPAATPGKSPKKVVDFGPPVAKPGPGKAGKSRKSGAGRPGPSRKPGRSGPGKGGDTRPPSKFSQRGTRRKR
jgi:hypothetical protein